MDTQNIFRWYNIYFAIVIIAFSYYLLFWQNSKKRIPNYKRKQVYSVLREYMTRTSFKVDDLYSRIEMLFSENGVCDVPKMFETLLKYYNAETRVVTDDSSKRANLLRDILITIRTQNKYFRLSKESAHIFESLQRQIQMVSDKNVETSINQLYERMVNLENQNGKSSRQFLIGLVIGLLGLVPFAVEIIKKAINSFK